MIGSPFLNFNRPRMIDIAGIKLFLSCQAPSWRSSSGRGAFPNDEAATELICLQLHPPTKDWKMPTRDCGTAAIYLFVVFGDLLINRGRGLDLNQEVRHGQR
jgi:hypothetical protein